MNNQKNTKKEENILVLCMSKLSLKPELNHYYYKTKENTYSYYDCIGQLEPACKVVIDELSKDSQSNHLKILVLNTNETIQDSVKVPIGKEKKSSYEFFKDRIKSFCSGSEPEYHAKLIANTEQIMKNQYPELRWIILELIQCVRESSNKTDSWYYKMDQILLTILKMNFDSKISPYISDQPSTSFTQILERRITTDSTDPKTNNFQEQLSVDTLKNFFQEQLTLYFHTASDDSDHISFYDSLYNLWHTSLKNFSESTKFTASNELINTLYKVIQMILDQKNLDSFLSCSDKDKLDKILLELDSLKRQQEHLLSILSTDTRMIDNSSLISNIISQMNQKLTLFLADKIQLKTYIIQQIWNKLILNSTNTICTNNKNDISTNNSHTYEDSQLQILEARKNLKIDFEQINIGTQIDSRFQDIITEICKPKNSMDSDVKINVYIDTQGGSRENSTILTAILELLKKSHTDQTIVKNIYATQYTPGEAIHEIQDKEDSYKIFDLVSGIDEFLSYMHVTQLDNYFSSRLDHIDNIFDATYPKTPLSTEGTMIQSCIGILKWLKELLFNDIKNISEYMFLCRIDNLEKSLYLLFNKIAYFEQIRNHAIDEMNKTCSNQSKYDVNSEAVNQIVLNKLLDDFAHDNNKDNNNKFNIHLSKKIDFTSCQDTKMKAEINAYIDILYFLAKDNIYDLLLKKILMNEPKHSSLSSITSFNDKEIRCRLDLIKFVNYGISKDMIQQVLTVIEQYTPIYLYHKGIFHPEVVLGKSLKDDDNISNDDIKTCFDFRFNSKDSIHKSITQTLKKSCNDFSEEKKGQISLLQKERKNLMVCTSKKLLEIDPLIFKARNYIPDILIAHRLNTELIKSEDVKIICLVYSYFYIKDLRNTVNHAGDTREKNSKLDIVNKKHIIETIDNHLSLLKSM